MKKLSFLLIFGVCVIIFVACQKSFNPKIISAELIEVVANEHSRNNEMSQWILPYKLAIDEIMGVEIGISAQKMEAGRPESLLGRFVTDVMNDYAKNQGHKFDFTITNVGGLRGSLPQGVLTIGDIYSVFPFDNELVILTLSGKKVEQLCQEIAKQGGQVTDGIRMVVFEERAEHISISGKKLDTSKNYQVLTTDYLSFGNDKLYALADYSEILPLKAPLRDVIIDYIKNEFKNGRKINAKTKGEVFFGNPLLIMVDSYDEDWGYDKKINH